MEMISVRYDSKEGIPSEAVQSLFDVIGIHFLKNSQNRTDIEIIYGENVASNAAFSIYIPRRNNESISEISGDYLCGDNIIRFKSDIFTIYDEMLHGNFEKLIAHEELDEKKKLIRYPFVDCAGTALLSALIHAASALHIPLVQKSVWPQGKEFAVCLTHDVDEIRKTYQWITYPVRCIGQRSLKRLYLQGISFFHKLGGKEPYWTFDQVFAIEKTRNVRSTFFFLQESGKVYFRNFKTWRHAGRRYHFSDKKISDCMKFMHTHGWEVGLHGSFYSFNDFQILKKEKDELEQVLGDRIRGIRQHNLNLLIPDTWKIQSDANLVYDTTLGCNDCVGFRWGTCFPFRYLQSDEKQALSILEIPLVIEDTAYFRYEKPWEEFIKIAGEVERVEGILTLLWHHSVFNETEFPGWGTAYGEMIDFCIQKNAWITSGQEITKWWLHRQKIDIQWQYSQNAIQITFNPEITEFYLTIFLPDKQVIEDSEDFDIIKQEKNFIKIKIRDVTNRNTLTVKFHEGLYGDYIRSSKK